MGQANLRGLLAFSAILALGHGLGWAKPVVPDRPLQPGTQEQVSGKRNQAGTDPRVAEPSGQGGDAEPAANKEEKGKDPHQKARPESGEDTPAREEKSDCDDCVIVLPEGAGDPAAGSAGAETAGGGTEGSSGMAGSAHLAGTLWGLFMVARPRRLPRTIIRGVTVP